MKIAGAVFVATLSATTTCSADALKDAYNAGYDRGYKAGVASVRPNTVFGDKLIIQGSNFDAAIGTSSLNPQSDVKIAPNSSIAIIPNAVLPTIREKLGTDFMQQNNILLNNRSLQP